MHWVPKFGRFQIAHKISGRVNAWSGRYVDLGPKTGLFALLDRSRYDTNITVRMEQFGSWSHVTRIRLLHYRFQ